MKTGYFIKGDVRMTAVFRKGESYNNQRVFVSSVFPQGGQQTGYNVALSIANDQQTDTSKIQTSPMLVYDQYMVGNEKKDSYTTSYSAKQWDAIEKASNKDGDKMVILADLIPNNNGKGLVVNTNTLKTPEHPFNIDKHRVNTIAARDAKKASHDASAQKNSETSAER